MYILKKTVFSRLFSLPYKPFRLFDYVKEPVQNENQHYFCYKNEGTQLWKQKLVTTMGF